MSVHQILEPKGISFLAIFESKAKGRKEDRHRKDSSVEWGSSYPGPGENMVPEKFLQFIFGLEKEKNIIKNP